MEAGAQRVMDTFVELADTLSSDYDIADFLHLLVERCQEILRATTGGVLVEGPDGSPRLVAATSEHMRRLEQAELDHEEGPCLEAYRRGEQVLAPDLRQHGERWPNVLPHALDQGLLAVLAFPLRLRGDCIGALNLYRDEVGGFEEEDVRLGQAFADVAAIGILQERKVSDAERRAEQLQYALTSRIVIEQAKGAVHERHGVHPDEAFELLRNEARTSGRKLLEVCQEVIDGRSVGVSP